MDDVYLHRGVRVDRVTIQYPSVGLYNNVPFGEPGEPPIGVTCNARIVGDYIVVDVRKKGGG